MKVATLFAFAVLLAATANAHAIELNVWAASSLTDVLKDVARDYEQSSSDHLVFNFAGSNLLARQIVEGAPADLFISADEQQMDELQKAALIVAETRQDVVGNTLAVVAAATSSLNVRSGDELGAAPITRLALADPHAVPAGIYAAEFLHRAGLWEKFESKIRPAENVRAAAALVSSGNADAAIVYASDARTLKDIRIVFAVPADAAPPIRYPAAVVSASKHRAEARAFLDFLRGERAGKIFEHYGFLVQH